MQVRRHRPPRAIPPFSPALLSSLCLAVTRLYFPVRFVPEREILETLRGFFLIPLFFLGGGFFVPVCSVRIKIRIFFTPARVAFIDAYSGTLMPDETGGNILELETANVRQQATRTVLHAHAQAVARVDATSSIEEVSSRFRFLMLQWFDLSLNL